VARKGAQRQFRIAKLSYLFCCRLCPQSETERAAAELVEAKSLVSDDRFSSVARLKTSGSFRVSECFRAPKIRALVETTYIAGLRKAGMPEE
jgi:hypothetical protein